jgi:hypothetical protein
MNYSTRLMRRPRRARPPAARAAAAIIATAAVALLAAACSGSPSATGPGGSPNAGGSASSPSALGLSRCMRSHGIPDFPDPNGRGQIPEETAQQLGVSDSRLHTAASACQSLSPKQLPAPVTAQEQQDYLRAAACMRSHGITNFPDPAFSGGGVHLNIPSGIDTSSQQFNQARQACEKFIPAGLPYSGSQSGG